LNYDVKTHTPKWQQPSDKQRLEDPRTILRVQELARDLRHDLNALPLFAGRHHSGEDQIKKVLFVGRDQNRSLKSRKPFYNARLLVTFNFDHEANKVWEWLQWLAGHKSTTTASDEPKGSLLKEVFEPLFDATAAVKKEAQSRQSEFDKFEAAIIDKLSEERGTEQERKADVHNSLIEAVATLPYRGLLLSLFEDAFKRPEQPQCCWFFGLETGLRIHKADLFIGKKFLFERSQTPMEFPHDVPAYLSAQLNLLFTAFLNPFLRGDMPIAHPGQRTKENLWGCPYEPSKMELNGFVVPAYEIWSETRNEWQGGSAGWVVVFAGEHFQVPSVRDSKYRDRCIDSWNGFVRANRHFVQAVRQARLRELALGKYDPSTNEVDTFLQHHLHHLIGWKFAPSGKTFLEFPHEGIINRIPVRKLPDTKWKSTKHEPVPFAARRLCSQFRLALLLRFQAEENRRMQKFMLEHETNKFARAFTTNPNRVVCDLFGRHLMSLSYPSEGAEDSDTEVEDLKRYWPLPFSISGGLARDWMTSIHRFAARRWRIAQDPMLAASLQEGELDQVLESFWEKSLADLDWEGEWDQNVLNGAFPNPVRKFLNRMWLAVFANYFKHRAQGIALPPCKLKLEASAKWDLMFITMENDYRPNGTPTSKVLGTADLLRYDLLNAARWRGLGRQPVYAEITKGELEGLVTFRPVSVPSNPSISHFITRLPMPHSFFKERP
jgi:hypothetical protein